MDWSFWNIALTSWGVIATVMLAVWVQQRRTGNAGVVDVIWAGSLGAQAVAFALAAPGWGPRRALIGLLGAAASLRLTVHLARRVFGEAEDGRYAEMREDLGDRFDSWMLLFFQIQALLAAGLGLVFLLPMSDPEASWRIWDVVAPGLWLVAVLGQAVADRQLSRWKSDRRNQGRTCRAGLWRYSRHPNYFFEWLLWVAYASCSIGLPGGHLTWLAPAVMLYLVLKVTGIPPTERQAVRSRGDDYRAYQRTTNAFFPGPTRNLEQESHA